ncbi:hypothetical protein SCATT_57180 [Streptantibioticus cattleyicolor NRRL 8057 = DSM 46488]|uniref:Uncharacterized protein n=1 Tax=Streptantibioticus cattleyicolor (strain ATCC 35852 / DSM 46488 / JCM 4925 / NBRC 14057 / NRRL 8057) TaxID=1003195 RepID=F8JTZ1_STREN|nr:hypothetical protein SCATT_57180 [Streptantibioticus cattleyicolor NRRL 8057 = DSM 46488]MYS62483.1 hypothetical protein [Streptomyces sp. SID5468]CCB78405.1 protein of unknown function [Streptantibioticus cattleyicolor NRRL 8057 = DSM 46488]
MRGVHDERHRNTPWEEVREAFTVPRQQGKVLHFGSSDFTGRHIARRRPARHAGRDLPGARAQRRQARGVRPGHRST